MVSAALVDAGPIVAAFGPGDKHAKRYRALFKRAATEGWALATALPCVVEASHMIEPPHRYAMLRWVASGAIKVFPFEIDAVEELVTLMKRWTEPPRTEMDLADAALVQLAVELGITQIMTIDVRDFARYRLPNGRAFEIL